MKKNQFSYWFWRINGLLIYRVSSIQDLFHLCHLSQRDKQHAELNNQNPGFPVALQSRVSTDSDQKFLYLIIDGLDGRELSDDLIEQIYKISTDFKVEGSHIVQIRRFQELTAYYKAASKPNHSRTLSAPPLLKSNLHPDLPAYGSFQKMKSPRTLLKREISYDSSSYTPSSGIVFKYQ